MQAAKEHAMNKPIVVMVSRLLALTLLLGFFASSSGCRRGYYRDRDYHHHHGYRY
jgi:hypothetical protein